MKDLPAHAFLCSLIQSRSDAIVWRQGWVSFGRCRHYGYLLVDPMAWVRDFRKADFDGHLARQWERVQAALIQRMAERADYEARVQESIDLAAERLRDTIDDALTQRFYATPEQIIRQELAKR